MEAEATEAAPSRGRQLVSAQGQAPPMAERMLAAVVLQFPAWMRVATLATPEQAELMRSRMEEQQ